MIDIESRVFTILATELREKHNGIMVVSEWVDMPAQFPFVSIEEADNYTYTGSQDSGDSENHANVMYEINVYSKKTSGKKQEAKAIMNTIDSILYPLGFTRTSMMPMSNDAATIYRIVARYTAVVSKNNEIYRR